MAKDKIYNALIHAPRWGALRRAVLSAHPLCERCEAEGYVTAATEVHHRQPVEYGVTYADKYRLMYDPNNLSPLCHSCHVRTHTELGRRDKESVRQRNEAQAAEAIQRFFCDD